MNVEPTPGSVSASTWLTLLLGGACAALALVWGGGRSGASLAAGCLLAAGNLWALGRVVRALLQEGSSKGIWVLVGMGKVGLSFVVLYALMRSGFAEVMSLTLGLATLPVGIVVAQLLPSGLRRGSS